MDAVVDSPLTKLLAFLDKLDEHKIWYHLEHIRESVMVLVAIPGQRWEVEFFADGHVEVERFISPGKIEDEDVLSEIIVIGGLTDNELSEKYRTPNT